MVQLHALLLITIAVFLQPLHASAKKPNVVIIFTDDQGYGDIGCFGAKGYKTPHLDRMAKQGRRFTDFYVAQAVCGASRVALLTGCYPNRLGMFGAPGPNAKRGIHPDEILIPELLKAQGYATGMFGKWHLGDHRKSLPIHHGFDEYYGLPYSNDMWPHHPGVSHLPLKERLKRWPHLPMVEGDRIIDTEVTPEEQTRLTTDYTERALTFIARNKEQPFFLYLAHSMPHVPLFVAAENKGTSGAGLYGDVIKEIDWSVGEVLSALKRHGISESTLVIFTTDNGPWLSYGNHAGSAGPLREGKATSWEGGVRVPCIMQWPGKIPAGSVCSTPAMTIDILPTIARLTGGKLPEHKIDGKDIWPLIAGTSEARSPHEAYYFYWGKDLQAVRRGKWSLHLPHSYRSLRGKPGNNGIPGAYMQKKTGLTLYDLETDIGQSTDLSGANSRVVKELTGLAEAHKRYVKENHREPARH